MNRSYLNGETTEAVTKQLAEATSAMSKRSKSSGGTDVEALLVDGKALLSIMAALDGGDSSPKAARSQCSNVLYIVTLYSKYALGH
jgi:hypothetical protein